MKSKEHKAIEIIIWLGVLLLFAYLGNNWYQKNKDAVQINKAEINQQDLIKKSLANAPKRGSLNAPLVLVEFGDFECPVCKETSPIIEAAIKKYQNELQHVWIHATNEQLHPNSESAAIASQCAAQQHQFWAFHDELFKFQDVLSPALYQQIANSLNLNPAVYTACLADPETTQTIKDHRKLTSDAAVDSTPTLKINEASLSGLFTKEELDNFIQKNL